MRQFTREEILRSIREKNAKKEPVVAVGAGAGLIAKAAQSAGVDFIYSAGTAKLCVDGFAASSAALPLIDSNDVTKKMAERLLPILDKTPVIAGVCAFDAYRDTELTVGEMIDLGYSGIANTPSVGMYGADFRAELAESGIGYEQETAMISACRERDIFTVSFAYTPADAAAMAMAGADVVIAKYRYNAKTKEKSAFQSLKKMVEAAVKARQDTIVMIQTCPSSSTEQVQQALITTGAQGFIGATGIEKTLAQATLHTVFAEMLRLKR